MEKVRKVKNKTVFALPVLLATGVNLEVKGKRVEIPTKMSILEKPARDKNEIQERTHKFFQLTGLLPSKPDQQEQLREHIKRGVAAAFRGKKPIINELSSGNKREIHKSLVGIISPHIKNIVDKESAKILVKKYSDLLSLWLKIREKPDPPRLKWVRYAV